MFHLSEFSASSRQQLSQALRDYVNNNEPDEDRALRHAFGTMCRESHALEAGPDRIIDAVRAMWTELHDAGQLTRSSERDADAELARLLRECLEWYHETRNH